MLKLAVLLLVPAAALAVAHASVVANVHGDAIAIHVPLPPERQPCTIVVVDGTWLASYPAPVTAVNASHTPGLHTVAVYGHACVNATDATLLGWDEATLPARVSSAQRRRFDAAAPPTLSPAPATVARRPFTVGSYLTTIQYHEAIAFQKASAVRGSLTLAVEDVIRSNGAATLANCTAVYGVQSASYFLSTPAKYGYYCVFLPRPGDTTNPPCPNAEAVLEWQADVLASTGVDWMLLDATNLVANDTEQDVLQLRPAEVVAQTWTRLRAAGKATPSFGVWNKVPTGALAWQLFLDHIYNNASVNDLVWRDAASGKQIFFLVDSKPSDNDPTLLQRLQSNGGRDNILTPSMWANSNSSAGVWSFFADCRAANGDGTTSIPAMNSSMPCNQTVVHHSPLGSMVSVNHNYQVGYSSLPFMAPSKLGGLTFRQQFAAVLATAPDHIFTSSFNEHSAGGYANPYQAQNSMGLEWDEASRRTVFVDGFNTDIVRSWEATVQGGNASLRLQQSCIRVAAVARALGLTSCAVAGEACCTTTPEQVWTNVWSLSRADGHTDFLLTTNAAEVAKLTGAGGGWRQVCAALPAPLFCTNVSMAHDATNADNTRGPFQLAGAAAASNTRALYRCRADASGRHYFSVDSGCEGAGVMEYALGWVYTTRTGAHPRSLRRCSWVDAGNTAWVHGLDSNGCPAGYHDDGVMGYVL